MDTESPSERKNFSNIIISYYRENGDNYPWRKRDQDSYRVLIAEIFLQRTGRKQVETVFESFISRFPDIEALSEGDLKEIKEHMKPLGLHWRGDKVKKMAVKVVEEYEGILPDNKDIYELPGIGSYVGSMFLCLAHGENTAPVDVNVGRILNRVFGLGCSDETGRLSRKKIIKRSAKKCAPKKNIREYNLGLVDFGNKLCTSNNPSCCSCPLSQRCSFYNSRD